jgi:hypothetical protein
MKAIVAALCLVCGLTLACGSDDDGSGGSAGSGGTTTGGSGGAAGGGGATTGGSGGTAGGTTTGGTGGVAGGGGAAGGAATGGAGGQACNSVALLGSAVGQTSGTGAAPTPQGGTLVDGTWVLTKSEVYSGTPDTSTSQITFTTAGGKAQVVVKTATSVERVNYDMTVNGTSLTAKETCPGSSEYSYGFTATATEFTEFIAAGNATQVNTYTKQ